MDPESSTLAGKRSGEYRIWWVIIALFVAWPMVMVLRGSAAGEEAVAWQDSFEHAADESRLTGKPMFVYFTADWCPPCIEMSRFVFSRQGVADGIESDYIPVKIDLTAPPPGGEAERLMIEHAVDYIPAFMVIGADGRVLARTSGYYSGEGLLAWLGTPTTGR